MIVENDDGFILYAVFHHIIFDAISEDVFKRNLLSIIKGNIVNADDSFLKASAFTQQIAETNDYTEAEEFYDSMLVDVDDASELLDSVLADGPGSTLIDLDIDNDLIDSFLEEHNLSENVFFSGVFAYTLSRFVGSEKVLFNIVENGRDRFGSYDSIGMFVNTLPLLIDCKNQDIGSFMDYISDVVYDVMRYNYYPFRLLANKYDIKLDIIFQFVPEWVLDNYKFDEKIIAYKENDLLSNMSDLISDLSVEIIQNGNDYHLSVVYSGKYSSDFVDRFVQSYKFILNDMLHVKALSDISYVSSDDLILLDEFNDTAHDLLYDDVFDAFNENLGSCPDNSLVSFMDCSYSYGEGAFIADRLAKRLVDLGVKSQDRVAFLTEPCEYYMFCVLGVLSCGGVYVPLDDKLPDNRIIFILDDADCGVVIVSDETYNRAVDLVDDDVVLLNISEIINGEIGTLSSLSVCYGDLACILYTSGTTGVPKGVKITRKSIINMCENYIAKYNLDNDDVFALFSTIGFDMSSFVICVVMCAGACLVVVPEDIRLDMLELNKYFISHNVSHTYMTTQVAKLFMESIGETSLDVLVTGGEKLGEFIGPDDYCLVDSYGPTESFGFVDSIDILDKLDCSCDGFANFNVRFYVLDDELRQVPIGAVGELFIGGYQLSRGYLNLDDETSRVFIDNPFDDGDFGVLYRTGDMCRFLADGSLAIVGRRDSQFKIRGNRVELAEVESIIRSMDIVEDVTVQTLNNNGINELIAYVVLSADLNNIELVDYVCNYVSEYKPNYMVPSYIVKLNHIPLNLNGKVDKNALPDVDVDSLSVEYVAPRSETEKAIVDAFVKVFNRENIGVYDDFIRLGGDSLSAIKLLTYLDGFNISVGDVLSLRTPSAIAASLRNISFDLDIYSLDGGCPLSESQLNVYLDIKANDKEDSYLIPLFIHISEKYGVDDIRSALAVMFDVHPVLGMCVSDDFDVSYLVKGSKPSIIFKSDVNNDFINEFLTKPFNLYDSLCRFLIVEDDNGWLLYAVFHHIIFDAISKGVFKRNLYTILEGGNVDEDYSFMRTSAFNQQIGNSKDYTEAENFYDSMLVDIDDTGELLDSVLADGPGSTIVDLDIDNKLFSSFLESHNVSLNVFFSSVFAYTLSRFVGSEKVLFNIVENGRDRFNNYDSVGMFVNTLPLLIDCKNQNIDSFMEYVSSVVYGVMRYNYYPFRVLANNYNIKSDILFQFLPEWVMGNKMSDTLWDNEDDDLLKDMDGLNADLSVRIIKRDNDYLLSVVYCDKYSNAFIDRFIESYKLILNDILSVEVLGDISYVSYDDLLLLDKFNGNDHNLLYDDVLDAFNVNLVKYPDNILVSYMDCSYSYGEGAFIADKIAKSLTNLGVKTGDCVGFLVPRSELYMFSVLGILSCGSVFVPLDDNLPDERLSFILTDSDCKAVIVSNDTDERLSNLGYDGIVLNISNIVNCDYGSLSNLPVNYGDLATILYTSGSTGLPKGVKITRKALVNVAAFYVDTYGLSSDDVYGLYPSIGFDAGCESIFKAIYARACLSIVPDDLKFDMLELNKYFIDQNVSHTMMTTQVGKLFMDFVSNTSLKYLFVGGENLGEFESPKDYILVDEYGPTESNNFITSIVNSDKIHFSSVGHLNYNSKAYVLDSELRRVPLGAVGELYLSGYQLSDGYMGRDDETSCAFIDNPFDNGDYNVLYRTGDMVRFLPDGSLGIVGRRDGQLKVRGNRVELGEVESVIRSIGFVEDVTVQTICNDGDNELIAYVVVSDDEFEGNLRELICNFVASSKPDYMVPSFVVGLYNIPLTVNGKVDRGALPEVDFSSLVVEYVAPRSETEKAIVDAFEKVFNREHIGVYDDFVLLGGDSLSAIKLLRYLDGFNISVGDILSLRTPSAIAGIFRDISFDLDLYSLDDGCPLNESQLNVYLDIIAKDKKDSYLIPLFMDISKEYDKDDIRSSLDKILEIHPLLDMCVSDDFELPYLIKGSRPSIIIESDVNDNFMVEFLTKSFDLYDSLSRFLIVESEEGFVLYGVFHHIIFDAISEKVFKRDLNTILSGGDVDLDDSFLKVSAFNQQIVESSDYQEANEFYDTMLVDVDDAGQLLDSVLADGPGSTLTDLYIDKNMLNSFLVKHNISENVFFTSIFAYTLSRFVGNDKVLFNIVENGRDRFGNYDAIGMFVNTLPLLIDCKNQDISSFVEYVSSVVYGVMRYNYYPFRILAKKYDINSNILFQFLPEWIKDTNIDGIEIDLEEKNLYEDRSDFIADFGVRVIQKNNNYILNVIYSDKYANDFINRFVESYKLILNDFLSVNVLGDISYVSSDDLILLNELNKTEHDLLYDDVLDAFNANLIKYPDNILVSYGDCSYTYSEGAFLADKIALSLKDMDVNKQDKVGFFVERSELYMFSVLGI